MPERLKPESKRCHPSNRARRSPDTPARMRAISPPSVRPAAVPSVPHPMSSVSRSTPASALGRLAAHMGAEPTPAEPKVYAGIIDAFRADSARGVSGVYQFMIRPDESGPGCDFHVVVEGGNPEKPAQARIDEGVYSGSALCTIEATRTVLEQIKVGQVEPVRAFMTRTLSLKPANFLGLPTAAAREHMNRFESMFPRK